MDSFMDFYFEEVFSTMDRDSLNMRFKRRELVEYFNTVIAGCAKGCHFVYFCLCYTSLFSTVLAHGT